MPDTQHLNLYSFVLMLPLQPRSTLFPYTTLFRSRRLARRAARARGPAPRGRHRAHRARRGDRKSTRLNSSHTVISYAVFCLKKKKTRQYTSENSQASVTSVCTTSTQSSDIKSIAD